MELLHDHVSTPQPNGSFDPNPAKADFREKLNELLNEYGDGFEMNGLGEIQRVPDAGFHVLTRRELPSSAPKTVKDRVSAATRRFHNHGSTLDDRRAALKDLADAMEMIRPRAKLVLNRKDEDEIFQIMNQFGIRHAGNKQKTAYDDAIFFSWMFYYWLATIHACTRLIEQRAK